MTSEILASVLYGPKELRVETQTILPPAPNELQIAILCTGICGSDIHYYLHYQLDSNTRVREPLTLGHESAGVVVEVGSDAQNEWKVGDKVALEVGLPCQAPDCKQCNAGRYNICPRLKFKSSAKAFPHKQGTLKSKINHPAAFCHRLPDNMSLAYGALAEPLSVAVHANRRANLPKGSGVLILGGGPVGLLNAFVAKLQGASQVVIGDVDQKRLDFAVEKGFADSTFLMKMKRPKDIVEALDNARRISSQLLEKGLPDTYDSVFECTGAEACLQAAIYTTTPGGKILLIGMGNPIQTLPISQAAHREIDLIGVFRYTKESYKTAIQILEHRGQELMSLVTHRFAGFDGIQTAFDTVASPSSSKLMVLKVLIDFEHTKV